MYLLRVDAILGQSPDLGLVGWDPANSPIQTTHVTNTTSSSRERWHPQACSARGKCGQNPRFPYKKDSGVIGTAGDRLKVVALLFSNGEPSRLRKGRRVGEQNEKVPAQDFYRVSRKLTLVPKFTMGATRHFFASSHLFVTPCDLTVSWLAAPLKLSGPHLWKPALRTIFQNPFIHWAIHSTVYFAQ